MPHILYMGSTEDTDNPFILTECCNTMVRFDDYNQHVEECLRQQTRTRLPVSFQRLMRSWEGNYGDEENDNWNDEDNEDDDDEDDALSRDEDDALNPIDNHEVIVEEYVNYNNSQHNEENEEAEAEAAT